MKGPVISIIIPSYNASEYIIETLESIKNQTFEDWECLIIDDHSSDNTFDLLVNYAVHDPRFKLFKRPNDYKSGGCGARNYGFDISKGSYIQWFDADDVMDSKMLEIKLDNFKNNIEAVICRTVLFKGEIKNTIGVGTKINSEYPFVDFFNGDITYYTPGPMWRKSFLVNLGFLFNTELLNVQEWEFYCKILLKNPNIIILNETLIYYRKHSNSIWGRKRTKEKIMSQFNATKSIFYLSETFKKEIIQTYFLRLYKFYRELSQLKKVNVVEKMEIKKELLKVFYEKPLNFKDTIRIINSIIN